jgi:RND family efflux transporter MFP subunit
MHNFKTFVLTQPNYKNLSGTILVGMIWIASGCTPTRPLEGDAISAKSAPLPKVATIKPKRMALTQKTEQPAKIEAYAMTRIHAKVNGFLEQILVDIGDRVTGPTKDDQGNILEHGQLLAVLVAPELSDELAQKDAMILQAQADIDQAKAAVEVAESLAISADAWLAEAVAGERKAEADFARWKSEADRINILAANKTVTSKLAEETMQQMNVADASRDEVKAKILSAKAKKNESRVAITKAKADLRSIEAKLSIAHAEFSRVKSLCEYLQIRAPYSGIISTRNFDPGSLIQLSQANDENPLFTIVQTDKVRITLNVPESESVLVNQEGKAAIKVPALANRLFEGKVARTSWVLNASTRTLQCEIEVANQEGVLRPGMYATVELTVAHNAEALAIPKSCIVLQDGKPTCNVVTADSIVTRQPVQTGIISATDVEIVNGLDDTQNVISANASAFKDGQRVEIAAKQ